MLSHIAGAIPKIREKIYINDFLYDITLNLESALRHLRSKTEDIVIWADAVCICQHDLAERSSQVQHMGEIYRRASTVLCWLGEAAEDSGLALGKIKDWGEVILNNGLDEPGYLQTLAYLDNSPELAAALLAEIPNPFNERAWRAIASLVERAWWVRLWVLQEFVLGKEVILICGHDRLDGKYLIASTLAKIEVLTPILTEALETDVLTAIAAFSESSVMHLYFNRAVYQYTNDMRIREVLFLLLSTTSRRLFTVQQDRIYGLLGMIDKSESGNEILEVDYSLSLEDVFVNLVRSVMLLPSENEQALLPLYSVAAVRNDIEAPSWVPWRLLRNDVDCPHPLLSTHYNACKTIGNLSTVPKFSADGTQLLVDGIRIDRIAAVFEHSPQAAKEKQLWEHEEAWNTVDLFSITQYHTGSSRLEAFLRTITADFNAVRSCRLNDDIETAHTFITSFLLRLTERICITKNLDYNPDTLIDYLPSLPADLNIQTFFTQTAQSLPPYPLSYDYAGDKENDKAFYLSTQYITLSRCLFKTAKGYIGLGPPGTRKGDEVFVLYGANTPFVLRPRDEGIYLVVGEAYVEGWMDGEAAEEGIEIENLVVH